MLGIFTSWKSAIDTSQGRFVLSKPRHEIVMEEMQIIHIKLKKDVMSIPLTL
jgi:hypothetical protein